MLTSEVKNSLPSHSAAGDSVTICGAQLFDQQPTKCRFGPGCSASMRHALPAIVRSRISSRSNSASAAKMPNTNLPAAVVVSTDLQAQLAVPGLDDQISQNGATLDQLKSAFGQSEANRRLAQVIVLAIFAIESAIDVLIGTLTFRP
jgi:hypothetical protein